MRDLLQYVLQGIPVGCVYALLAIGLVLTYKTSGVFNLAFGAQAFASAAIIYDLRERHHWPLAAAFLFAVVVVGPLFGLVLDRALFRHLGGASWVVKLVSALGLLVAIPEIVRLWFGTTLQFAPPSVAPLFGIDERHVFRAGDLNLSADEAATVVATVLIVIGLGLLFRYSAIGLQMRAVVESPRLVELLGVDSERVGLFSWMLSSTLAALAGVLLAPLFASIDGNIFTLLIVAAIAAAAFGRLTSIPLTLAGGLLLGVLQQILAGELPNNSILAKGIRPALPFAMLFVLLVLLPSLRSKREVTDPLSGVDPPPPAPAASYKDEGLRRVTRIGFPVFLAAFVAVNLFVLSGLWVRRFTEGLVYTVLFLSITAFTGLSGQISLGQAAFAGFGAFTAGQLATDHGIPVLAAVFIGAVVAAVIGALLAVPALRLGGIFLTLLTLAFALMAESVVFPLDSVSGGQAGVPVPRPSFAQTDQSFFLLVFAIFGLVAMVVILVRNGTSGRVMAAIRGSETAAASIGIDARGQRVILFVLAAGIAGLGGGLYGMLNGQTQVLDWPALLGVAWVVIVVALGTRTVDGAVNAGIGFVLIQWLVSDAWKLPNSLTFIAFGLGAITYAKHPDGVVEWRTRISIEAQVRARHVANARRRLIGDGIATPGYRRTGLVVLATLLTGGLFLLWWAPRSYVDIRRLRHGRGIGAGLGFLATVVLIPTLFLLPHEMGNAAGERGSDRLVDWRSGRAPFVALLFWAYLAYRYSTQPLTTTPTQIGIVLAVLIGIAVILSWVGEVQGALNVLAVEAVEPPVRVDTEIAA